MKTVEAEEYRRKAAECIEIAERVSLLEDRERMVKMAKYWLDLAKRAEAEDQ